MVLHGDRPNNNVWRHGWTSVKASVNSHCHQQDNFGRWSNNNYIIIIIFSDTLTSMFSFTALMCYWMDNRDQTWKSHSGNPKGSPSTILQVQSFTQSPHTISQLNRRQAYVYLHMYTPLCDTMMPFITLTAPDAANTCSIISVSFKTNLFGVNLARTRRPAFSGTCPPQSVILLWNSTTMSTWLKT